MGNIPPISRKGRMIFPIAKWVISHYTGVHMITDEQKLLSLAEAYCAAKKIEPTTLGRWIVNDGKFFERLASGGGCTTKTVRRVEEWFDKNSKKRTRK
jgi:hypothetical protein